MTILLDVGNSAVKWSWSGGVGAWQVERQLHRGVADLAAVLVERWGSRKNSEPAVGCSVAATGTRLAVEEAVRAAGLAPVRWLDAQTGHAGAFELANGYRDPLQLGTDRWHAMLGAAALRPGASLVVVNAGTATTVDCVLTTGARSARFIGGCIAPGARLMFESLERGAAGLPLADGVPMAFPDHTDSAIATGVLEALTGLVERVWRRLSQVHRTSPEVLLAGGDARQLAAALPPEARATIEDNLVLRGIAVRLETG
jgi:type III pantothenate kinase